MGFGGYFAPEYAGRAILPDGSMRDAAGVIANDPGADNWRWLLQAGTVPPPTGMGFRGGYVLFLNTDGQVIAQGNAYPSREALTWAVQHPAQAGSSIDSWLAKNPYGLPTSLAQAAASVVTAQVQNTTAPIAADVSAQTGTASPAATMDLSSQVVAGPTPHAFGLPADAGVPSDTVDLTASTDAAGGVTAAASWMPWALAVGAFMLMGRPRGRRY